MYQAKRRGGAEFPNPYLTQLMGEFGILCYSEVINDPVIWSHYADKHAGLALGFDFPEGMLNAPLRVSYDTVRPTIPMGTLADIFQPTYSLREKNIGIFQQGFTKKAQSWSYEKEWRQFVNLDECKMIGDHYFREIPSHCLEVVLGARCSMDMRDIGRLVRNRSSRGRPVQVKKCRMAEASYEFEFDAAPTLPTQPGIIY
jgi:hypothetical protein